MPNTNNIIKGYCSSFNELASNDDFPGRGINFEINYGLVTDQYYYLEVQHSLDSGSGDYCVIITDRIYTEEHYSISYEFSQRLDMGAHYTDKNISDIYFDNYAMATQLGYLLLDEHPTNDQLYSFAMVGLGVVAPVEGTVLAILDAMTNFSQTDKFAIYKDIIKYASMNNNDGKVHIRIEKTFYSTNLSVVNAHYKVNSWDGNTIYLPPYDISENTLLNTYINHNTNIVMQ